MVARRASRTCGLGVVVCVAVMRGAFPNVASALRAEASFVGECGVPFGGAGIAAGDDIRAVDCGDASDAVAVVAGRGGAFADGVHGVFPFSSGSHAESMRAAAPHCKRLRVGGA